MEAFLFVLDSVIFVVMAYMGLRDARRPEGRPARSLFRLDDAASSPVQKSAPRRRTGIAR